MSSQKFPIVVLISGNGTNLQALIDAEKNYDYKICGVISNNKDAYGLIRAREAHIPRTVISHTQYATRDAFDQELQHIIMQYSPRLILLAGFMRKLGKNIVRHFAGRMINIHPSLLPKYPGLNTHEKALTAQDQEHGVSIHFVTEELDAGPIICQAKLKILPNDTVQSLEQRIHVLEHKAYPLTAQWFAEGRITLDDRQVLHDGKVLTSTGYSLKLD